MAAPHFTSAALDEIADYLVSERDTHKVLDRRFRELGIVEPRQWNHLQRRKPIGPWGCDAVSIIMLRSHPREIGCAMP